jgi:uncharacterized protein YcgL (UPF0745 family)
MKYLCVVFKKQQREEIELFMNNRSLFDCTKIMFNPYTLRAYWLEIMHEKHITMLSLKLAHLTETIHVCNSYTQMIKHSKDF